MRAILIVIFCCVITGCLTGCLTSSKHNIGRENLAPAAAATLKVPANIDIVAFDGERVEIDYMPMYGQSVFKMTPGKHNIILRYSGLSDGPTFDQKQMLYSPKVELALNAEKNHEYMICYKTPAVDMQFDKEIKSLTVWIKDAKTKTVVCAPATAGRIVVNKSDGGPQKQMTSVPAESSGVETLPPLEQLKHWWGKASERERGEFLKWSVMQK